MFERPTLPELISRGQSDIESRLPGTSPRLRRSVLGIISRAQAGAAHELHGYLAWLALQVLPSTAGEEKLADHASWWKEDRNNAVAASGDVTCVGTDGSTIPVGEVLQRSDGVEYTTDAEATISGTTATVAVTATSEGQDTNAVAGVTLSFVSPVPGVQSSATVAASGITGGADIEDIEAWRERFRDRVQQTPQGGSLPDYEKWAREVEGVTRVWPFSNWLGLGTVGVFFVRDDDDSIIPDSAEVQTVYDYIGARRPAGMKGLYVMAPTAVAVDMTISLNPNTASVQAAVTAELVDLFGREASVEDGNGSGTILISHIDEAISLADGEDDHAVVTPAADVTFGTGEIGTLGNITF